MNPVRGAGRGRTGGRRGWRHQYYATGLTGWQRAAYGWPSPVQPAYFPGSTVLANFQEPQNQELDTLKGQLEYHEDVLDGIKKRITELESQASA